jgi:hypothetical protein
VLQHEGLSSSLVRGQQVPGQLVELALFLDLLVLGHALSPVAGTVSYRKAHQDIGGHGLVEEALEIG